MVTERGERIPSIAAASAAGATYAELAARLGATVPVEPLEVVAQRLHPARRPPGTTDRYLADGRRDRMS